MKEIGLQLCEIHVPLIGFHLLDNTLSFRSLESKLHWHVTGFFEGGGGGVRLTTVHNLTRSVVHVTKYCTTGDMHGTMLSKLFSKLQF